MANFSYIAADKNGKEKKGSMEGTDKEAVISSIKASGLMPISVKEQGALDKELNFSIGGGVKPRDLSIFCRQFVSILSAGVSIINALDMLSQQTENAKLRIAIRETEAAVEKGENLADAMEAQGKIFPPILISMIAAGEASGSLEVAFERMSEHFEKSAKLKSMIKKAMIYPIAICVVAVGVIIIMLTFVIPQFTDMFEDAGSQLPAITQLVVDMSDFVIKKWYILLGIVVGVTAGIIVFKKTTTGHYFFSKLGLKAPLFGKLTMRSASSSLARTLSTLMAAGMSLIDSLEIVAKTMKNAYVKDAILKAREEVTKGVPLSKPLEESGIFPPMVYQMIRIGEETGNLEGMLDKVADYYDEEVEAATASLTAAMEPAIIVVLAVIVGFIVIAIMTPMMSLNDAVDNMAN